MSRLWVRLSIAFGLVVLAVFFVMILTFSFVDAGADPAAQIRALAQSAEEREALALLESSGFFERLANIQVRGLPLGALALAGVTAVAAIIAGAIVSRRLTTPLAAMQTAARAIGTSQFSHRVDVTGDSEIADLARSFNRMAAQLEEAEGLRRNLLSDVAHELRNPLHVIEGNLRALLDGVYPLSLEEVARLLDQTEHLTRLVNDLHELAQAEAHQLPLDKQPTEMASLVKETAVSFQPTARTQEINLRVELLGETPTIVVDAARLRQALSNLIANALRHTPAGGNVTVAAERRGDICTISVRDSGAGIAAEHLPHVFDRFYRIDPARSRDRGGTGLGLAIAQAIVEAHDGRLTAHSDGSGQGSTFTILLPAGLL